MVSTTVVFPSTGSGGGPNLLQEGAATCRSLLSFPGYRSNSHAAHSHDGVANLRIGVYHPIVGKNVSNYCFVAGVPSNLLDNHRATGLPHTIARDDVHSNLRFRDFLSFSSNYPDAPGPNFLDRWSGDPSWGRKTDKNGVFSIIGRQFCMSLLFSEN